MERFDKKAEERAMRLMEAWPKLTEEQRNTFALAIQGQAAFNLIIQAFGKEKNEKTA